MTKDEIKDRISMALKDPVLQQGFEIICKDFSELEKENAELKRERKRLNDNYHYWNIKACHIDQELYDTKQQLTKAKDHIKKLLDCLQQDTNDPQTNYYVVQYMTEAEQFLKEIKE